MESPVVKRALISVSNKLGVIDFARGLAAAGIEIVSTGGTKRHLTESGLNVTDISKYTQFPEMMDGRVKTLHPKVFAGILCRHNLPSDMSVIAEHGILPFELIVVNLYPFAATIARPGVTMADAVEQIDIGGPSLIRAAAKNSDFVTVVCDPMQYSQVLAEVSEAGSTKLETRKQLMATAFRHTAQYDTTIADYFSNSGRTERFPQTLACRAQEET